MCAGWLKGLGFKEALISINLWPQSTSFSSNFDRTPVKVICNHITARMESFKCHRVRMKTENKNEKDVLVKMIFLDKNSSYFITNV